MATLCSFTHDLDFGALLAMTGSAGLSVLQVRAQDVLPSAIRDIVPEAIEEHAAALERGAIISIDEVRSRVRILPLRK